MEKHCTKVTTTAMKLTRPSSNPPWYTAILTFLIEKKLINPLGYLDGLEKQTSDLTPWMKDNL